MTTEAEAGYGRAVLSGLKEFQRSTAEYAFERLYGREDSTRRFLIADEVGLGKTLVAAGVIAKAIDHLRALGRPRIDVIYICSNQAIARQNLDRIRHRHSMETRPLAERITLLPYRLDTLDQPVNLIALTPGTSFNTASAEGVVEERVILFRMLAQKWGSLGDDARLVFLGVLSGVDRFRHYEYWYPEREIDTSIVERFGRAVGPSGSDIHSEFMEVRDRLAAGLDANSWRLVFSSWAMVPRAIAVMASYDAERQYIPDGTRASRYEGQLLGVTGNSYSLFSLLVPSAALADAGDPLRYPAMEEASGLLESVRERLRPEVERLTREAPTEGQPQEIWYAVAPLLLDGQSPDAMTWLHGPPATRGEAEQRESTAWVELAARVREGLLAPGYLGRPPGDLLEVMALLAVGSPANATLRALSRITSAPLFDVELKRQAMGAAHAFRSLFRAPTSEGLLRNVYTPEVQGGDGPYWRRVLAYAIEGGLSAVLDEFFHVLREAGRFDGSAADLVSTLSQVLQMAARPLAVSEWEDDGAGVHRRTYPMRQHLARRYANDGSAADQQANQRLDDVRDSFNSPFWPFVLGTTSIGQEGLDFHWYCHAVVHWNLPRIRSIWNSARDVCTATTVMPSGRTLRRRWESRLSTEPGMPPREGNA